MNIDLSAPTHQISDMVNGFLNRLPYLVIAVIVFFAFFYAAKGLRLLMARFSEQRKRARSLGMVLGRLVQGGVILLGLLIALVIALPSFRPAQLIQVLGLSSVAIGFAFKDILQNYLAGILLLLNEPFRIGDQIIMGGYEGTVENIETRATYIRTYDGRRVVIPNSDLYGNSVTVNTAFQQRRLQYDIGIGYGDDIERAKQLIVEAAREVKSTLDDPVPEVLVVDLAGSSVNLRVRWWINPPQRSDVMRSTDEVLTAVKNKLTANGIDLPFPTEQILFHDQTEQTDGDRARQREGWPAGGGKAPGSRSIAGALFRPPPGGGEQSTEPQSPNGRSVGQQANPERKGATP